MPIRDIESMTVCVIVAMTMYVISGYDRMYH